MQRVWRVEDARGDGPYQQSEKLRRAFGDPEWDIVSHRRPRHGSMLPVNGRYVFVSKRELLDWFDVKTLKKLIFLGYKVRSYLVAQVVTGDRQGFVREEVWCERTNRR